MGRLVLATKVFFRLLFDAALAERVKQVVTTEPAEAPPEPAPAPAPKIEKAPAPKRPARSEALTLLATLQREGRFVDFLKEELTGYSDAQIGAVARDVHRDCGAAVERLFALRPVLTDAEGAEVHIPDDAGRFRLTGNVTAQAQRRGRLVHHGWEATKCEVPTWTGSEESARIVAPAEVELR